MACNATNKNDAVTQIIAATTEHKIVELASPSSCRVLTKTY